jgi:hypothetical protein
VSLYADLHRSWRTIMSEVKRLDVLLVQAEALDTDDDGPLVGSVAAWLLLSLDRLAVRMPVAVARTAQDESRTTCLYESRTIYLWSFTTTCSERAR